MTRLPDSLFPCVGRHSALEGVRALFAKIDLQIVIDGDDQSVKLQRH